jgi:protease-4
VAADQLNEAIRRAATDDRIRAIVLELDELAWVSTGHAQTLGAALTEFRDTGKQVIAYGNYFEQPQYLLASFADAVYLHPEGQAMLSGSGVYQLYFSELLDKLKVTMNIFRVGEYKDFVEPFERTEMSPRSREANQTLVRELWQEYLDQVAANRALGADEVAAYATEFAERVEATRGDLARTALEAKLVDELLDHDQIRVRLGDLVGFDDQGDFKRVDYDEYLAATGPPRSGAEGRHVSLIVAQGGIVMGDGERGVASAPALTNLIRKARADENSAALVLRIDSPGGSSFAAELIRQELEVYQMTERPVVVSMGNAAASGGYWIAATADHIVANPTTITGSIGVFAIAPTFEKSLAAIGVRGDGVGTTPLSGTGHPLLGINAELGRVLQSSVAHTYDQFVNLVARGRDMTPEAVDAVAQGRVWSGRQALGHGLVDQLGDLEVAIDKAVELADLEERQVRHLRPPVSPRELLLRRLFSDTEARAPAPLQALTQRAFSALQRLDDPGRRYALCLSCAAPIYPQLLWR